MFNKYIKIVLAIVVFALSIQQFVDGAVGSTGNGIMLILLSLLFVLLYFRNEFLILAFFQLRKQNLVGEKYFRTAIKLGLNMDHDLAMAKLNLAGILFSKRRKIEAQKLLKEAQDLDKNGMMKDQIKMMKNQMKKTNIPNQHFGRNNMRRR